MLPGQIHADEHGAAAANVPQASLAKGNRQPPMRPKAISKEVGELDFCLSGS